MFGRPNVGRLKERIDVAGLIEALNHKDERVGEAAAQALGELADPSAFDLDVGATILGKLDEFHAEDRLIMCYRDNPSPRLRTAVALALEQGGFHSGRLVEMLAQVGDSEGLLHATTVGDGIVALQAAQASKRMSDPRPVDALIRCLANKEMREHAAKELGMSGDARALRPLVAALQDEMGLAPSAADALGELGNPEAIEPLVAALERAPAIEKLGYPRPACYLRVHAASALARIAVAAQTPSALDRMSSPALVDALISVAEAGVPFFLPPEPSEWELVEAEDRLKLVKDALEVLAPERLRAVTAKVEQDAGSQVREGAPASAPDVGRVQLSGNSVWEELANFQDMASRQGALLAALTPIEEADASSVFARIGVQNPNRYEDQMTALSGLRQYAMTAEGSTIKVWHLTLHEGSAGSDFLYVRLADAPPLEFIVCALTGGGFLGSYATGSNLKEALKL